jgi:hypothetical protein
MFGLPILEVAIGLSFVYLLLALICTAANETIAAITKRRAGFLKKGICSLLGNDPDLTTKLLEHPLVASLAAKKDATPSYLPASKFAVALMDVLTGTRNEANNAQPLRAGIMTVNATSHRNLLCIQTVFK